MLVLTRKVGERIRIGDDITVVVTKSAGNRITLGIEAPRDVPIVRGELESFVDAFKDEDDAATDSQGSCSVSASFPPADASTYVPTNAR